MPKVKYRLFSVLLTTLKMLFYSSTEEIQPCASPQRSIASEEFTYSDKGTTTPTSLLSSPSDTTR